MIIRDGVTQFVCNGFTKHSVPIVHTPECHHVREAFKPYAEAPLLDVVDRYVRTGTSTAVDLLAVLVRESERPDATVGLCQHCIVRGAVRVVA